MKKRFRRVRGGFIPPTPFYKKYRTAATKKSWRTVPLTRPTGRPLTIPGIGKSPVRVTPVTKPPTRTQPKLTPKPVIKKVQTQEDMARRKRRAFRYLPTLYRKRPKYPIMKRRSAGLSTRVKPASKGATSSFYTSGPRLTRKTFGVSKMTPIQIYHKVDTGLAQNGSGYQAVWSNSTGTRSDMLQMLDMKPLYMTSLGNTAALKQIYLESYTIRYMMTNTSNTTAYVTLFEMEPRNDHGVFPNTAFSTGIQRLLGTAFTGISYGMTPFMSKMFTVNFHVKRVYNIEMPPGGTHIHYSNYRINKIYSFEEAAADTGNEMLKPYTRSMLMVAHGEVVNTKDANRVVTSAPVNINFMYTEKRRFRFGEVEVPSMVYEALPAAALGITPTNLELYDEGSGAVEEYEAA